MKVSEKPTCYRSWLRSEFEGRYQRNGHYSLRAFARDLEVAPSTLSLILNGKRGLSRKSAGKLCELLRWSKVDSDLFKALVNLESYRSLAKIKVAQAQVLQMQHSLRTKIVDGDTFRILSDWQHFAILQLTSLKNFQSDLTWMAKALKLPKPVVRDSVSRLQRTGLLSVQGDGKLKAAQSVTLAPDQSAPAAFRIFHRQILQQALQAIDEIPTGERHLNSSLIPVRETDYLAITETICKFHRKLVRDYGCANAAADSVYAFSTQYFPVVSKERAK